MESKTILCRSIMKRIQRFCVLCLPRDRCLSHWLRICILRGYKSNGEESSERSVHGGRLDCRLGLWSLHITVMARIWMKEILKSILPQAHIQRSLGPEFTLYIWSLENKQKFLSGSFAGSSSSPWPRRPECLVLIFLYTYVLVHIHSKLYVSLLPKLQIHIYNCHWASPLGNLKRFSNVVVYNWISDFSYSSPNLFSTYVFPTSVVQMQPLEAFFTPFFL